MIPEGGNAAIDKTYCDDLMKVHVLRKDGRRHIRISDGTTMLYSDMCAAYVTRKPTLIDAFGTSDKKNIEIAIFEYALDGG